MPGYKNIFGKTNVKVYTLTDSEYTTRSYMIPHDTNLKEVLEQFTGKGVVKSLSVSNDTFTMMLDLVQLIFFYQKEACDDTSHAFRWLYSPICVSSSTPNAEMPVCERNQWSQRVINSAYEGIIGFCITAGMLPDHSNLVTVSAHYLDTGAGKGHHFDLMSTKDQKLIYFRGILSINTTGRWITFTWMESTKEKTEKGETCTVIPGVKKHQYFSPPGCSFYALSAYASGTHPAVWTNDDKTAHAQLMHDVKVEGDGSGALLMFNAPLSSIEKHNQFFASLPKSQVHLAGENYGEVRSKGGTL